MEQKKPVAVIAGAGRGNGAALARRFAKGGYAVALLARDMRKAADFADKISGAVSYACDVGDPASVAAAFGAIQSDLGAVSVLLFNAGSGVFKSVEEITPAEFEASWRVNAYGALLCSQAVLPGMKARGAGSILFTGATASLLRDNTTRRVARLTLGIWRAMAAARSLFCASGAPQSC
jgi:NAD(P)-dependent dehydrogenase (short-subunit alcohol dehydrogenase family)